MLNDDVNDDAYDAMMTQLTLNDDVNDVTDDLCGHVSQYQVEKPCLSLFNHNVFGS